jgi:hypothetical protein
VELTVSFPVGEHPPKTRINAAHPKKTTPSRSTRGVVMLLFPFVCLCVTTLFDHTQVKVGQTIGKASAKTFVAFTMRKCWLWDGKREQLRWEYQLVRKAGRAAHAEY